MKKTYVTIKEIDQSLDGNVVFSHIWSFM